VRKREFKHTNAIRLQWTVEGSRIAAIDVDQRCP
jgi:hypothetical protein